jgi:hypothetical protein
MPRCRLPRLSLHSHLSTMLPDLTDDEHRALVQLVRSAIDDARYPLSPRVKMLRAIPGKTRPPGASSGAAAAVEGGRR